MDFRFKNHGLKLFYFKIWILFYFSYFWKVSLLMSSSMNHLITCQKTIRIWKMHLSKSPKRQQDQITVSKTKVIWIFKISLFMILSRNYLITRQRDLKTVSMTKRNRIIQRTTEHASTYCNFFGMQFQLIGDWICVCVCVLVASKIYHKYTSYRQNGIIYYMNWSFYFVCVLLLIIYYQSKGLVFLSFFLSFIVVVIIIIIIFFVN